MRSSLGAKLASFSSSNCENELTNVANFVDASILYNNICELSNPSITSLVEVPIFTATNTFVSSFLIADLVPTGVVGPAGFEVPEALLLPSKARVPSDSTVRYMKKPVTFPAASVHKGYGKRMKERTGVTKQKRQRAKGRT